MLAKQLSFLPPIDEKEVRDTIIKELKKYKALKVQLENRKEWEAAGDQHTL